MSILKKLLPYLLIYLFISSCSSIKDLDFLDLTMSEDKDILSGKRLDISVTQKDIKIDIEASKKSINLEDIVKNLYWNEKGKNNYNSPENLFINDTVELLWEKNIGDGDGTYNKIYAQPVGNALSLFVLDSEGKLVALNINNGDTIWEINIFPEDESLSTNIDGGLALSGNNLIASSSYGEIIKINIKEQKIEWKKNINKPVQGAPSIYNNFIYQMTVNNELLVININTGEEIWRYSGSHVSAIANGAVSPAVDSNLVVFPSNTGELIALETINGSLLWNTSLVIEGAIFGSLELTDIDSGPVVHEGLIYSSSLSGKFAVVDLASGGLIWEMPIKSSNNSVVNGDAIFILRDDGSLINLFKNSGYIRWIANIYEDVDIDNKDAPVCSGPLLASNNIWLVCQDGKVFKVNSNNGKYNNTFTLDSPAYISPIIINGTMIFYTEDAEVIAYR